MPFIVQSTGSTALFYFGDNDSGSKTVSYQTFDISCDEVDLKRDRLSIILSDENGEYAVRFSLENDNDGNPRLRFDVDNSCTELVELILSCVREEYNSFALDEWNIYYLPHPHPNFEKSDLLQIVSPFALLFHRIDSDEVLEFTTDSPDDETLPMRVENHTLP